MGEGHVELARRMVEWFNERDAEAAQAHSTDEIEIVPLRAAMEGTSYRGPGAYATFLAASDESWEELRFEPHEFRELGGRVVVIGQLVGRARLTGAEVGMRLAMLYEFEGDKVSAARTYADVEEALVAARRQC
jgi:ketosteroid isomerase-like protein